MNILVCGGSGFIGSAFIRNHLKQNPQDKIANLDNLSIGSNIANLRQIENNPNYLFVKDSITNPEMVNRLTKESDIVINFAAETHVDRSIANPEPFIKTNVLGTYNILEAVRKSDKLFVHISTDEIYGDAQNKGSFTEEDALRPSNPYAATKASADLLVESYHRTYGLRCITTRCTNNFGPYQFPEKLIPKTIIRALRGLKVPLYDGGYQIRSWIYVLDHVNAIEILLEKGKSGQVYNITSWNEITNKTIVERILKLMNKPLSLIEKVGDRPGHDKIYSIDSSKIQREIGWKPKYEFDKALGETVLWYQNNPKWWEPLADEKTLHPQPWTINQ